MRYFLSMRERKLAAFARSFFNGLSSIASLVNITSDSLDELEAAVSEYENVLDEHLAAQVEAKRLTQKKKQVTDKLKGLLKLSTKKVRGHSETTDAQLKLLGLQPYDRTQTFAAIPESAPLLTTEIRKSRRHILRVRDRADINSRAKPRGVLGAEIWLRIGDAGVLNEDNYRYLGLATSGSFSFEHDAADIGKQAFYVARWLNRKGERGGWSDTASATIAA